jgi:hypothetical protein
MKTSSLAHETRVANITIGNKTFINDRTLKFIYINAVVYAAYSVYLSAAKINHFVGISVIFALKNRNKDIIFA